MKVMDYQKRYFETWLNFIGLSEHEFITVEPTMQAGPEQAEIVTENMKKQAAELAEKF